MRIVGIGDLVLDYYYNDKVLYAVDGGMSVQNIIANIAYKGMDTTVISACGDDIKGEIAIKSLEELNVDTSNIKKYKDVITRAIHINRFDNTFTSKRRCPICNEKNWYMDTLINPEEALNIIKEDDILVFDNLNSVNREIIKNSNNKVLLDLGQYFEFEDYSDKEILDIFKEKFEILNLNERVEKYFNKRFKDKKIFKAKLLIITRGDKGADFIYNGKTYNMKLTPAKEVDSNGAGDAFFSSIIYDYFNSKKFDIEEAFNNAVALTSKVVSVIGSRGHLHKLYFIKKNNRKCTCIDFSLRKKISRCSLNANNLESRILSALKTSAYKKIEKLPFNELNSIYFTGTGGSFASALFSSHVINKVYGINTNAFYPRDLLYRNNSKVDKVILFSYSGTTDDLLQGTKEFSNDNKIIITKGIVDKVTKKTNIQKNNIISYYSSKSKGKDRGFLSFEGTVVPATLFYKLYNKDAEEFVKKSISYWKEYFDKYFKDNKNLLDRIFTRGNIINIFYGDYTTTGARDLESKIIESGVFNLLLHEKKNFSHGRFINYENLNNNYNIYLKTKTTSKYEEKLLKYLNTGKTIVIESKYDGIDAEYDLLLMSQYFIYYLSKHLNIDLSKPNYSEDAMKIYFYKGEL